VDIAAPPATHADLIGALAPRVPMLICQKPFCGSLDAARAAVAVAARHGARLAVHENVRFQPWYAEAGRLIAAGALGAVMQVTFRLRPGDGRGPDAYSARQPYFRTMPRFLIHETGVHWIDTFRALLGEPTGVFARLVRLNPVIAGEDAGFVLFDFATGARALFDGNRLADHATDNPRRTLGEMLVEGTAATLRLDGAGRLWLRAFGRREEAEHCFAWQDRGFGGDCVALCHRAILADWSAGRASPVEAAAYLRTLEIEEAVYRSAGTGTYVVL
jgi:predicted dehydrogenase